MRRRWLRLGVLAFAVWLACPERVSAQDTRPSVHLIVDRQYWRCARPVCERTRVTVMLALLVAPNIHFRIATFDAGPKERVGPGLGLAGVVDLARYPSTRTLSAAIEQVDRTFEDDSTAWTDVGAHSIADFRQPPEILERARVWRIGGARTGRPLGPLWTTLDMDEDAVAPGDAMSRSPAVAGSHASSTFRDTLAALCRLRPDIQCAVREIDSPGEVSPASDVQWSIVIAQGAITGRGVEVVGEVGPWRIARGPAGTTYTTSEASILFELDRVNGPPAFRPSRMDVRDGNACVWIDARWPALPTSQPLSLSDLASPEGRFVGVVDGVPHPVTPEAVLGHTARVCVPLPGGGVHELGVLFDDPRAFAEPVALFLVGETRRDGNFPCLSRWAADFVRRSDVALERNAFSLVPNRVCLQAPWRSAGRVDVRVPGIWVDVRLTGQLLHWPTVVAALLTSLAIAWLLMRPLLRPPRLSGLAIVSSVPPATGPVGYREPAIPSRDVREVRIDTACELPLAQGAVLQVTLRPDHAELQAGMEHLVYVATPDGDGCARGTATVRLPAWVRVASTIVWMGTGRPPDPLVAPDLHADRPIPATSVPRVRRPSKLAATVVIALSAVLASGITAFFALDVTASVFISVCFAAAFVVTGILVAIALAD